MSPVEDPPSAPPLLVAAPQRLPDRQPAAAPAPAAPVALRARLLSALGAILAIALATRIVFPHALLGYDQQFALIWGHDLAHGHLPDYEVALAPTPHPLTVLVGAVAA